MSLHPSRPIQAYLMLWVEDPELRKKYREVVEEHNVMVSYNRRANAGFDLFVPEETTFYTENSSAVFINHGVKAQMYNAKKEMYHIDRSELDEPTGFYLYPRSSISKTPLMLANHVGVIDSGYTGFLIGAFRYVSSNIEEYDPNETYKVEKHTRLLQIVHPNMTPFCIELVETKDELELNTTRGEGGFGSTGV